MLKADPYLLREFIMLFPKRTMLEYMEKRKFKPYIEFIPRNVPTLLKNLLLENVGITSAWIHNSELKNREELAGYSFHNASDINLKKVEWVNNNYFYGKNSHYILAHKLVALLQEKDTVSTKMKFMKNLSYDNLYHTFKKSKSLTISQIVGKLTDKYEDFFEVIIHFKLYNLAKLYIKVDKHNTIKAYQIRKLLQSNTRSSDAVVAFQPQLAKLLKNVSSINNSYTRLNKQVNNSLSTFPPNISNKIRGMLLK